MIRKSFTLTNSHNEIIRGDLRFRESTKNSPTVIICHDFNGFKDWGFFPLLAETLSETSYTTITFNFSRNGIGPDLENFTELDKFARNTSSHQLEDLGCIVNAIKSEKIGKGLIDPDHIGLFGHGHGGGLAILFASRDDMIQTLVIWSSISTLNRYNQDQLTAWEKKGFLEIENKMARHMMSLSISFLKDIQENKNKLDIMKAASKLKIPVLVIHGELDESVPVDEAHTIYSQLKTESKDIMIIEGANHSFGISHPSRTRNPHFDTALDLSESWFDKYLNL
jgi:dienelactone hydrolase